MMTKLRPITCGSYTLSFDKTLIMGILNITPDSFSDGGLFTDVEDAVTYAKKMVADGADLIDVGGESTRPGSVPLSEQEELARVLPVVKRLSEELSVPLSIDTYKPGVANVCLAEGVNLLNDITGLTSPEMIQVAARHKAPVVMMHMKGTPQTMQQNPEYTDVLDEIKTFFEKQIAFVCNKGIEHIILDPGIGFGKTADHNLQILKHLDVFAGLCCPLLIGPSRKNFIGVLSNLPVQERLEGTLAAVSIAVLNGANIIRVHDVKACKRAVLIADAIRGSQ